jgi:ribokinase
LICNELELAALIGHEVDRSGFGDAARAVISSADQVVVVTLGEHGALAVAGESVFEQASFPVSTIDTVGAGDAFVAGFVIGSWWSAGVGAALRLGCAAGALATTVKGAQPSMPTLESVTALLG